MKPVAILSTTVIPIDGTYKVLSEPENAPWEVDGTVFLPESVEIVFAGTPHYIGHPDTKNIVEALGAVPAPSKLFPGLKVGECALTVTIKQGRSTRTTLGHTESHQSVTRDDLVVRALLRIE